VSKTTKTIRDLLIAAVSLVFVAAAVGVNAAEKDANAGYGPGWGMGYGMMGGYSMMGDMGYGMGRGMGYGMMGGYGMGPGTVMGGMGYWMADLSKDQRAKMENKEKLRNWYMPGYGMGRRGVGPGHMGPGMMGQ